MNLSSLQCYMCGKPATSHEHVPPKCVFPHRKDLDGKDLRVQLITVPSCEKHNSEKSRDDEFLMVSLAGIIGNNSIGYRHNLTKVKRAIVNSSGRLLDAVFLKRKHLVVRLGDSVFLKVIWGTPDYKRLENCFEHIARAVFFHHFRGRFEGRLKVLMGYLYNSDKNSATFTRFVKHRAELELKGKERFGCNPSVFFYQFTDRDQHGLFSLRTCFYEGVDIFAAFMPDGVVAPVVDLTMKLIEGGIKSYITLDGELYEFN